MYKHILIPTDGSPLSQSAVKAGVRLAKSLGARVTGFFAAPAATPFVFNGLVPTGFMTQAKHEEMIAKTAENYLGFIEKECKAGGVRFRGDYATNEFAADAIMAAAQKHRCDLIVMASHGRRGLAGVLLGSETQKVLTHSRIPVLVHR